MAHTLPDYSTKYKMATIFGQIDTGELAARLGSPDTFDRRGNVVFMDDFEATVLHWGVFLVGAGSSVVLSTADVYRNSQSCKLHTDINLNDLAEIRRSFALPVNSKIGMEFSVSGDFTNTNLEFWHSIYTGARLYVAKIRYHYTTKTLSYADSGDIFQPLSTTQGIGDASFFYSTFKLVIDYDTHKYVRLIVDKDTYDLSTYDLQWAANATTPRMHTIIQLKNTAAAARTAYIDDVILTQNEP